MKKILLPIFAVLILVVLIFVGIRTYSHNQTKNKALTGRGYPNAQEEKTYSQTNFDTGKYESNYGFFTVDSAEAVAKYYKSKYESSYTIREKENFTFAEGSKQILLEFLKQDNVEFSVKIRQGNFGQDRTHLALTEVVFYSVE